MHGTGVLEEGMVKCNRALAAPTESQPFFLNKLSLEYYKPLSNFQSSEKLIQTIFVSYFFC